MKRIGIDCRFAATQSGLGRYTRELVTHLLKRDDGIHYTLFVQSENEAWLQNIESKSYKLKAISYPHYSLSEQINLPRVIAASDIDLFFSPHFNVPLFGKIPFIVTIHDLILHTFPQEAPLWKRLAYRLQMRHAIRNSVHIIAVSEFTKNEILKRYFSKPSPQPSPLKGGGGNVLSLSLPKGEGQGEGSQKISIIHEGISPTFSPRSEQEQQHILQKYHLHSPFFLYVGSNKNHKNVDLLKRAADIAGVTLICIPESTGSIPDDDLPALYSAATAFVTASLAEGFCLPAVEALACGCPVIASNRGAIPEITKGNAVLIEPTIEAFVRAFQSPPPKKDPIRLYDWEEAAEKTVRIIKSLHFPSPDGSTSLL